MVVSVVIGAHGTVTKGLVNGPEDLEIKKMSGDCPNYSILKIDQNTAKSPAGLRRPAEIPSAKGSK